MVKLLIADCCSDVNNSLKDFFAGMGLLAKTANDAEEIVEITEKSKPKVVIMDIRLNNQERWDVAEKIGNSSPNTKIIVMSTYSESEITNELKSCGIKNYLPKPIDMEKLLNVVKKELGEI